MLPKLNEIGAGELQRVSPRELNHFELPFPQQLL